ncbi:hypothetical protein F4819DRAFT_483297 [Hypoxylon fuscum]|nr:hypothetical protein F4819DRAFT_483297 [Hypoxylon fuscum]
MKFTALISSSCLWHLASARPAPRPINAPMSAPIPINAPFGRGLEFIPFHHKNSSSFAAGTHLPKMAPRGADGADSATTPAGANYTVEAKGSRGALTTHCQSNSSTYVQTTVPESAPAQDCLGIAETRIPNLEAGYWPYARADAAARNATGTKMLIANGACAFGVVARDPGADGVMVGTQDVANVIQGAIRKFGNGTVAAASNGTASKLAAAGAMQCGDGPGRLVNWALYHA